MVSLLGQEHQYKQRRFKRKKTVVCPLLLLRLGGGHIGTGGQLVLFDWKYLAGVHAGNPLDIADAHRIETAFYTHVRTGAEFAGAGVISEAATLIQAQDAVKWAGAFGNLFNNETVTSGEAFFRMLAGLGLGSIAASSSSINAVAMTASADSNHRKAA